MLYERRSRSYITFRIHNSYTKPERHVHIALKKIGIQYKMNPKVKGKLDITIPSKKVAFLCMDVFGTVVNYTDTYQKAIWAIGSLS